MSEFTPMLPMLKDNLRRVVDAYCAHTGLKQSSAFVMVVGSATPRTILLDQEADMKAGKYDEWLQRFSNAWPDGLEWPAGVARPPKTGGQE